MPNPTTISPDSICFCALLDHHGPRSRFEKQNSAKAVSCSLSSFPLQVTIIKDPATDSRLKAEKYTRKHWCTFDRDLRKSVGNIQEAYEKNTRKLCSVICSWTHLTVDFAKVKSNRVYALRIYLAQIVASKCWRRR